MTKEKNQVQEEEILKNEETINEEATQNEEKQAEETPAEELTLEEWFRNKSKPGPILKSSKRGKIHVITRVLLPETFQAMEINHFCDSDD